MSRWAATALLLALAGCADRSFMNWDRGGHTSRLSDDDRAVEQGLADAAALRELRAASAGAASGQETIEPPRREER